MGNFYTTRLHGLTLNSEIKERFLIPWVHQGLFYELMVIIH